MNQLRSPVQVPAKTGQGKQAFGSAKGLTEQSTRQGHTVPA